MTAIIILAGGSSSRLGTPKQNLIYQGQTLLARTIETALASVCRPVMVILGANSDAITPGIENMQVNIINNPAWQKGLASSIRLGIMELQKIEPETTSAILMLCDQPFVDAPLLDQLVQSASKKPIVASAYDGTMGPPVLFDAVYFDELILLKGQDGAKKLLLKYPQEVLPVVFPLGSVDIDTLEDYDRLNNNR